MLASIYKPETIAEVWNKMSEFWETANKTGLLLSRRNEQLTTWMWTHVEDEIMSVFKRHPDVLKKVCALICFTCFILRLGLITQTVEDGTYYAGTSCFYTDSGEF